VAAFERNLWSVFYLQKVIYAPDSVQNLSDPGESHAHAALWIARSLLKEGEINRALEICRPYAEDGDVLALSVLGQALWEKGEYDDALKAWGEVRDFRSLLWAGNAALKKKHFEVARVAYYSAMSVGAEKSVIPLVTYMRQSAANITEIERTLRKAIHDYPDSDSLPAWWAILCEVERLQDKCEDAKRACLTALARDQSNRRARLNLGWIYYDCEGLPRKAIEEFQKVVSFDPQKGAGYYAVGYVLAQEGQYEAADPWFERAISLQPERYRWYLSRAESTHKAGDLERAIELYRKAIGIFPDLAEGYYRMAWLHHLLGDEEHAIGAIEQAMARSHLKNPAYCLRAAKIYEAIGNYHKALNLYNEVLKLAPNNKAATLGNKRLSGR